jgi:hypothetical protein
MWNNHRSEILPRSYRTIAVARPNLSVAQSQELEELVTEYGDIFAMKSED